MTRFCYWNVNYITFQWFTIGFFSKYTKNVNINISTLFVLQEQVQWAVEGGADYIIAETFNYLGEAMLALEVIKKYGKG